MNRPFTTIAPATFDVVTGDHYVVTADDLPDSAHIYDGWASVERFGKWQRVNLGVPLCKGCDTPVPLHGVCFGCSVIHADLPEKA